MSSLLVAGLAALRDGADAVDSPLSIKLKKAILRNIKILNSQNKIFQLFSYFFTESICSPETTLARSRLNLRRLAIAISKAPSSELQWIMSRVAALAQAAQQPFIS